MNNEKYLDRAETLRYLGFGDGQPNEREAELLERCEREIVAAADPRFVWADYDISALPFALEGESIKNHLAGCGRVVLFAATLSSGVDAKIRSLQIENMAAAVVFDAMAAAFIEKFCAEADKKIAAAFPEKFLTWRFSPGYDDFPLETQKPLLASLDAAKKVGLSVNGSFLLTPIKSVTAVIGLSNEKLAQKRSGCASCGNYADCRFRRKGTHCGF